MRSYKIGLQWPPAVGCEKVQKGCVFAGDLKDPVKGLELTEVSCAVCTRRPKDLCWKAEGSALEARSPCPGCRWRLKLQQRNRGAFLLCFSLVPFMRPAYCLEVLGPTLGLQSSVNSFNHTQNSADPVHLGFLAQIDTVNYHTGFW